VLSLLRDRQVQKADPYRSAKDKKRKEHSVSFKEINIVQLKWGRVTLPAKVKHSRKLEAPTQKKKGEGVRDFAAENKSKFGGFASDSCTQKSKGGKNSAET